jgi:uncharacterized protein (DUF427 family)
VKAVWKGVVLAESEEVVVLEGNQYFPPHSLHREYFTDGDARTVCPWKGEARYLHVVVDEERNENAAWYYPDPRPAAMKLKGHVAFWRGVTVTE